MLMKLTDIIRHTEQHVSVALGQSPLGLFNEQGCMRHPLPLLRASSWGFREHPTEPLMSHTPQQQVQAPVVLCPPVPGARCASTVAGVLPGCAPC